MSEHPFSSLQQGEEDRAEGKGGGPRSGGVTTGKLLARLQVPVDSSTLGGGGGWCSFDSLLTAP